MLFESPRRVGQTLSEIHQILGERPACLARELTKKHEEVLRGPVSELAERFADEAPRGECTLVIGGADPADESAHAWTDEDVDREIRDGLSAGQSVRDLSTRLAERCGKARRDVYARALVIRDERSESN